MKALVLALVLAAPASAQLIPDEFPDRTPMGERVRQDLVERYRPFLSGLYSEGTLASGPIVGTPALYGSATVEGGYRFDSGDALALVTSFRAPLGVATVGSGLGVGVQELTGSIGVQAAVAMRRFSSLRLARYAEVGVGVGASFYGETSVGAVELAPRVAIPLSPTLSAPVGLRISQPFGGVGEGRPYLGISVGLRRIWADDARMVLE